MTQSSIYLGSPIGEQSEVQFLRELVAALDRRSIPTCIVANFVTPRGNRQIDFLVRTPKRLVHIELKSLNQQLPLLASLNGRWEQVRPDGSRLQWDSNGFEQARSAKFAISDSMRYFGRRFSLPEPQGGYKTCIESVICVSPDVPPDSRVERHNHVRVMGAEALFDLLGAPGPDVPWDDDEWAGFLRHVGVYPESDDSPEGRARRERENTLGDYRLRFSLALAPDLVVDLPASIDQEVVDRLDLLDHVRGGRVVTLLGPSGAGKTTLACDAAARLCGEQAVPVFIRCAEYESGRFMALVNRAIAPFASLRISELLEHSGAQGDQFVLILDQFDRCPPSDRVDLLANAEALRFTHRGAVVVTSTEDVTWPGAVERRVVALMPPNEASRRALAGGALDVDALPGLVLPIELAIAGSCAADLPRGASRVELISEYIRARVPTNRVRHGLQRLAAVMDEQARGTLAFRDAQLVLQRDPREPADGSTVDLVLESALLVAGQGRVRFAHETFERFLLAEYMVAVASSGAELGAVLRRFPSPERRAEAVQMEPDSDRRRNALVELGDQGLLERAALGEFGADVAEGLQGQISEALMRASLDMESARLEVNGASGMFGLDARWVTDHAWTESEVALLAVAGRLLSRGMFLRETGTLLDRTDDGIRREVARLSSEGIKAVHSQAVASSYVFHSSNSGVVPPLVVVSSFRLSRFAVPNDEIPDGLAWAMVREVDAPPGWGRLYVGAELIQFGGQREAYLMPELVRAADQSGAFHVRLDAIQAASSVARRMDPDDRQRLVEALSEIDDEGNWAISSTLVEALAACGEIEPMNDLETIQREVRELIEHEDTPEFWGRAHGMVCMQFEPEDVVGPYYAAIDELDPDERLRLIAMAGRASGTSGLSMDWIVRELAANAGDLPPTGRDVLRAHASEVATGYMMSLEATRAHLHGLRGWAKLSENLPEAPHVVEALPRAWRSFDEILFQLERDGGGGDFGLARSWDTLRSLAPTAAQILREISRVYLQDRDGPGVYERLVGAFPTEICELALAALGRRSEIESDAPMSHREALPGYLVSLLAELGDADTAERLRPLRTDPEVGQLASDAIRTIEARVSGE